MSAKAEMFSLLSGPVLPLKPIPFNRPSVMGNEFEYMSKAVEEMHISGDGGYTRACHRKLQTLIGAPKVLLTTSCTAALEMSALLLDLQPGDEVILPSFTFVSTVNAFALRGVTPVFADIRPDTLNLDERILPRLVTERTRVIVPVHYAGVACEMDAILKIASENGIAVVEDNAHGLFGTYKGRNLGTFGCLATQSFHETKNLTCGEGGALVINDLQYADRAEILREKGTNRAAFFRGAVDKYTWVDIGSSYLPSDILAAYLLGQLEEAERIQRERRRIWEGYWRGLASWAVSAGVRLPVIPGHCLQPYHMFYLLMPTAELRDGMLAHLKERGIHSVFHYVPLHLSPQGRKFGGREGDCPVTEDISARLLRLPFFNQLGSEDQERVVEAVIEFEG